MKQQGSQEDVPRKAWIALGLFLLLLGIALVVVPQISRFFQPSPFPSFKDHIKEGMTIEEVKAILGEPDKVEQLGKLVKVPIAFPLRDADGNRIDQDHIAKVVDADRLFHFRIRRTTVVVRFGEDELVRSCYETIDLQ